MPDFDLQVAMHHLNIKQDAKLVKQQQQRFWPDVMEAIEAEVQKLIECGFIYEEQHLDWVVNIVCVLKRMERYESVLTFMILI